MQLLPLNEFQRSLNAYAKADWLHEALSSPEMAKASEAIYAKGAKALEEFHAGHQKGWDAIVLLVDKLGKDYPYLDVTPLQRAIADRRKDSKTQFDYVIRVLKQGKTAGVWGWLSSWHPGILATKAVYSAAKSIYQKLRAGKDPQAFAAIQAVREAVRDLGNSKMMLGDVKGGLYSELSEALVQAFVEVSGTDLNIDDARWEVSESILMEPIHQVYPLGEHTSYLEMGSQIKKALKALGKQARLGD